jgi:hypothetical protein
MKKGKKAPGKNVKSLIPRAEAAFKNEFYLESSILISSFLEARLRTLITRVEHANPGIGFNLEQCLKRVKYLHLSGKDQLLCKSIEIRLIDDMRLWKNQRNAILKDLAEIHVSGKRVENLAQDGIRLLKEFTIAYKGFKREWKNSLKKES